MGMVNILKFCTQISDKMAYANSADPDQTAPEGNVRTLIVTLYASFAILKRWGHKCVGENEVRSHS